MIFALLIGLFLESNNANNGARKAGEMGIPNSDAESQSQKL
jgi:hypothetical protein